jgi:hypothetical protein
MQKRNLERQAKHDLTHSCKELFCILLFYKKNIYEIYELFL